MYTQVGQSLFSITSAFVLCLQWILALPSESFFSIFFKCADIILIKALNRQKKKVKDAEVIFCPTPLAVPPPPSKEIYNVYVQENILNVSGLSDDVKYPTDSIRVLFYVKFNLKYHSLLYCVSESCVTQSIAYITLSIAHITEHCVYNSEACAYNWVTKVKAKRKAVLDVFFLWIKL